MTRTSACARALALSLVFGAACSGPSTPPDDGGSDAGRLVDANACTADPTCDDGLYCNGVEGCSAGACMPGVAPCATGSCDEATDSCGCMRVDADHDGYDAIGCGGNDCDDADATRNPGATELCDASDHDEDCDPRTYGVRDLDGDFEPDMLCCNVDATGTRVCGTDCDDARANVGPTSPEVCNGRDDDCDTSLDEGVTRSFYPDADHDGFGAAGATATLACAPPIGAVENTTDCDDTNPNAHDATDPEICDSHDNDCDARIDEGAMSVLWYRDVDGDLFGDASDASPVSSCLPVAGRVPNARDCDDTTLAISPVGLEHCDGVDQDCDATVDEGTFPTFCADDDLDRHGDPSRSVVDQCLPPAGYVALCDDCNDRTAASSRGAITHPGAVERCDGFDEDCSMTGDTEPAEDADGDRHSPASGVCTGGFPLDDCDDANADVFGGQTSYFPEPLGCRAVGTMTYAWCPAAACCVSNTGALSCMATTMCRGVAQWDYDCSGATEIQPAATTGCAGQLRRDCTAPQNPISVPAGARCGEPVMVQTCVWTMTPTPSCTNGPIVTQPLGCH